MKTRTVLLLLGLICIFGRAYSQQKEFQWRIGASGGFTNYYGDLTPYRLDGLHNWDANRHLFYYNENYADRPSYKIFLEKQLNQTIGLMLNFGNYHFGMSDRYIQRDGDLYLENPNFARGLNFQNHTRDLGLSFVFKSDNDRLLSANSLIAPYFTIGLGYIHFEVKGDLLDGDGQRYDQNLPGIIHDGIYETNLPDWNTELVNGYDQNSWYANFGLGFRVRLGSRVEFFAQSDFLHTFTDFLDDVSGRYRMEYDNDFQAYAAKPGTNVIDPESPYRGHPDGAKDWIIYHGIGLKFNFGASKKTFKAPRLSSYHPYSPINQKETSKFQPENKLDSLPERQVKITNNFNYTFQLIETERLDSLAYATKILAFEQEIQKRETRILEGKTTERRLLDLSRTFDSQYENLEKDTRLDPKEKQDLLLASEKARFNIRYSMDSLYRRQGELFQEIDSLAELKRNLPLEQMVLVLPNMDSVFQKQVAVSDSVFRDSALSSEKKDLATSSTITNTQENGENTDNQAAPMSMAASNQETLSEARRIQIEEENKYLKSERDRILREYSDYQKANKPKKQKPQYIENTRTIQKENTVAARDEGQRRKRWWWPFAAAGGVATVVALSDNRDNDNTSIDSAAVAQAFLENQETILAISSAMIGVDLRGITLEGDSASMALEIPVDSLSNEEPKVPLFKSKEIVYFKLNQRIPDASETEKLSRLGQFMKNNEGYLLVVTGFADNTGNVNFNLRLAEERVNSVADFLKNEFGLEDEQLRLETGGQVIRGTRQTANELDRRVEVRLERK
ncbi:OmpA family protein [Cognataquiflexum rubidum]|uniref:OmpA family protein n=1 Tax=Cognataquiflexum rubidum TaxID=2922273 RepID=UPI001F13ACFA|nr:OmpA family protein [Cognataquiflexum rubidum]MCH6233201.1 OmpA family protein [Cognataquiflexum rubidum]